MAENKSFNEGWIGRIGEEVGEGMGCLDLWVGKDGLQIKQLPDGREVGEMNMNGHFAGPSGVKYALGENVLGDDGVLFVRATFWDYQLSRLKKLTISHGMKMRIYGKFFVETYPRQDGTTGQSVRINVSNYSISYFGKKDANGAATAQPNTQPPVPPTEPVAPAAPNVNVPF